MITALSDRFEPVVLLRRIGWNKLVVGVPRLRSSAVGVPGCTPEAPDFIPGYMMLMREGEGDGAREETVLESREALMSQF